MKITTILAGLASILLINNVLSIKTLQSKQKIEQMSFLQLTRAKYNANAMFEGALADDDKYDTNIKHHIPYHDYNDEREVGEDQLMHNIQEDLRGEKVNYRFD